MTRPPSLPIALVARWRPAAAPPPAPGSADAENKKRKEQEGDASVQGRAKTRQPRAVLEASRESWLQEVVLTRLVVCELADIDKYGKYYSRAPDGVKGVCTQEVVRGAMEEGATEVEAEVALRSLAELGFIYPRDDGPRGDDGWPADGRAPRWWGVVSTASDGNLHLDQLLDELSTI